MKLRDLLAGVENDSPAILQDAEISSVAYDSRKVTPGALFVAIHGEKTDGNLFVGDAIARGARVVVSEQAAPPDLSAGAGWVKVPRARKALSTISGNFYQRPAEHLKLTGVTGTNGKTTTVFLVDSILRAAGVSSGMFGTIRYRTPEGVRAAEHTTPESLDLQRFLAEVCDAGGTHATLEVSSHALALDRVWGCPFAVAVFTNLTRDHLDYHKTMDAYFAAKQLLFSGTGAGAPAVGVVNTDDPRGAQLLGLAQRTITYGLQNGADITTKKFALSFSGLEFTAQTPVGKIEVRSPLVGRINVYNILAAIGASLALGLNRDAIEAGIAALEHVPGRFARVDEGQPFLVIVDYAHTDDALRNLIQTARDLPHSGRIITLFGCGGDRDRTKRPLMGEAAGSLSDHVVLTSDNPRSEDPLRILNDAVVGLQKANANYVVEPDRERAIEIAMEEAREGDIVLLAGKGHETAQILKDRTIDFDDHEMARQALRKRGFGKNL
ncbi:MAG TPA: UDP-N-acetylmuramoyl-L-alanyl-D-glutamate--2,6-diaminopimelate ligase [Candidatus Acidoferrales bacterium]|nr:UDP-N-acetylmuramoyl-L-alanyl-D-glutamate--2,6-diaminopimelate ligase [Candidatus Acidoferrales bacterium]